MDYEFSINNKPFILEIQSDGTYSLTSSDADPLSVLVNLGDLKVNFDYFAQDTEGLTSNVAHTAIDINGSGIMPIGVGDPYIEYSPVFGYGGQDFYFSVSLARDMTE